jgi:hypothetical protein
LPFLVQSNPNGESTNTSLVPCLPVSRNRSSSRSRRRSRSIASGLRRRAPHAPAVQPPRQTRRAAALQTARSDLPWLDFPHPEYPSTTGLAVCQVWAIGVSRRPKPFRMMHTSSRAYAGSNFFRYTSNSLLTPRRACSIYVLFLLMRGVSGDDPEGGAGSGVPRSWLVTTGSGGFGNRSPGTTTRAARSLLHVLQRKCWGRKRGPEAQNRQGRSAERRGVPIARDAGAPRKRPGSRALFAGQPVPRKHRAPVGAPPTPQFRGWEVQRPGRECAAGTRECA